MIIREAHYASVKYTHDEEAMMAVWRGLREFAGIDGATMLEWVAAERMYGWSKDYWHVPGTDWFMATDRFLYGPKPDGLTTVTLWNIDEFTRSVLTDHGVSCVACGARSAWLDLGKLYTWDEGRPYKAVADALDRRQTFHPAPPLICRQCAIDLPMMLLWFVPEKARDAAVERLIARSVPLA